jgi:hypothetical protein
MTSLKNPALAGGRAPLWLRLWLRLNPAAPHVSARRDDPQVHRGSAVNLETHRDKTLGGRAPEPSANDSQNIENWFAPRRFHALLALLIFVAFAGVLLGRETFFFRDFGYFGLPLAHFHREAF